MSWTIISNVNVGGGGAEEGGGGEDGGRVLTFSSGSVSSKLSNSECGFW